MSNDSLAYVRNYYNVPAYKGRRVVVEGQHGVIVGGYAGYVKIQLDGQKHSRNYHPTYGIEYLVEGVKR